MNAFPLTPAQQKQQLEMFAYLDREMAQAGGAVPFQRYMEIALYAPGLGYYVAGASKFGPAGDFVTAPQISSLFSQALANQCAQVLEQVAGGSILEFGAGTGIMAADILLRLEQLESLPAQYLILELSPDLRERQAKTLESKAPHLLSRVRWLDGLPERFRGVMLANEVLDAMPVHRFRKGADGGVEALWVSLADGRLSEQWRPASAEVAEVVGAIESELGGLPAGYVSELNLALRPWLVSVAHGLETGVLLLIDYGHERRAFYHPQRSMGTLRCHFRHQVVGDPLQLPGLQDITAHVDFSAVAQAGRAAGLELLGYDNQANFLLGCGIDRLLAESGPAHYPELAQGVKQLLLPGGMGESFKVMGLGKGFAGDLAGFRGWKSGR